MLWDPAHFWALALLLTDDYRSVGIPMLPVVKGPEFTGPCHQPLRLGHRCRQPAGGVHPPSGGLFYGLMVLPFNGRLLQMAHHLGELPDDKQRAKGLFRWSILYLFGICPAVASAGPHHHGG